MIGTTLIGLLIDQEIVKILSDLNTLTKSLQDLERKRNNLTSRKNRLDKRLVDLKSQKSSLKNCKVINKIVK